jgi:hypothetical protein
MHTLTSSALDPSSPRTLPGHSLVPGYYSLVRSLQRRLNFAISPG